MVVLLTRCFSSQNSYLCVIMRDTLLYVYHWSLQTHCYQSWTNTMFLIQCNDVFKLTGCINIYVIMICNVLLTKPGMLRLSLTWHMTSLPQTSNIYSYLNCQWNCWSLRCSWSSADILDLTLGFNGLSKERLDSMDWAKTKETRNI